jgi:hypothetical protein
MAINGKLIGLLATTATQDVYEAPVGKEATVTFLQVSNRSAASANVTLTLFDASANVTYSLATSLTLPGNSFLNIIMAGKLILEPGDKIRAMASINGAMDIAGSVVEKD